MNVLEISVRSDIGGGPKHLLDLLQEFKRNTHEIQTFVGIPFRGEFSNALKNSSSDSIEIPYRRFSILTFIRMVKFVKKNNINIVHSHGRGAGIYSRLLKMFGVKVVHTFHGVHVEKSFVGRIKLTVDRLLRFCTDQFICVSESEWRDAISCGMCIKSKTSIIYNGVRVPDEIIFSKNKEIHLGTLSRLNYQKGLDILIDYIDRFVSEENEKIKVSIAGDGELEGVLRKRMSASVAKDIVTFVGATTKPIEFLSSLDGYISFARWEGMPLAVLEAMSIGLPCLLSDVSGNRDLIENCENGFLFKLDNYDDFKSKLKKLLNSKELRMEFGEKSKVMVRKSFSVEQMAIKTREVYENSLCN